MGELSLTAEIAIINRSGIAVAADSAATIGRKKVWKSANKLFSLGPMHDIGVMFYGSADLFGCHWEIIVKQFREVICKERFETVADVTERFLKYISLPQWRDDRAMQISEAHLIAMCIETINEEISYDSVMEFRSEIKRECGELIASLQSNPVTTAITKKLFSSRNRGIIKKFAEEIFKQKPVKTVIDPVEDYIYEFCRREENRSGFESGVVFFGYGDDEIYPSLHKLMIDGAVCDTVRTWSRRRLNLNSDRNHKGAIIPFAQTDVAALFMEGISPMYATFFTSAVESVLTIKDKSNANRVPEEERVVENALRDKENSAILDELGKAFNAMRQTEVVAPVIESIHSLPRDEMAGMAEAFVELTSMRRKVDSHLDTVGGAVDVAVISKGEGFVWIKRKTYFDAAANGDYLTRRQFRLSRGNDS